MAQRVMIDTPNGMITEAEALANDLDMIPVLLIEEENTNFRQDKLIARTSQIERVISRHLGIPTNDFALYPPSAWIEGSFNICLPIDIKHSHSARLPSRAVMRFPLPYNVGESFNPGTIDEKLRCEAATYVWMSENCPEIPIPRLLGMGFPGSHTVCSLAISSKSFEQHTKHIDSLLLWRTKAYIAASFGRFADCGTVSEDEASLLSAPTAVVT